MAVGDACARAPPPPRRCGVACSLTRGSGFTRPRPRDVQLDLFNPTAEVMINETQFSGLHQDGLAWNEVKSAEALDPLVSSISSSREQVLQEQGAGLSQRCVTIVTLRLCPTDGKDYGNSLYLIELATPPMARASGVAGLNLDDFCSVNTSLKTLTKCLTAMGSKKKAATPPLRDSRLTHLLGMALGDETALIHSLVYVPTRRANRAEAVASIGWAGKATAAKLKKGVYTSASSKAMVSQLQGVVASLDEPSQQMADEMREQMQPAKDAVAALSTAVAGKRSMLAEVEADVAAQRAKVDEQRAKSEVAAKERVAEQAEVRKAISDLKEQVEGVRSGNKLKEAMDTLKRTIDEEKVALRKQLQEMDERLTDAKTKLGGLAASNEKVDSRSPAMCEDLVAKGQTYAAAGKFKYASLMFMSAVKLMESIGLGRSAYVVPPVSALADLYLAEGMDEEAIALYKQAYSIEKDASGTDSPQLAKHLQRLGAAYEKQGKMEAATLTLEEAGSVLEHAHGPDHPEVQALREQLAALIEPEAEEEEIDVADEAADADEAEAEAAIEAAAVAPTGDAAAAEADAPVLQETGAAERAKPAPKKKKGDDAKAGAKGAKPKKGAKAKKGAETNDENSEPKAAAKKATLSRAGGEDEATVKEFSSQRMKARLEARNARLAAEGRELSLGSAPALPPAPTTDEGNKEDSISDVLQKKREMFRERMAKRKAAESGEAKKRENMWSEEDMFPDKEGDKEREWDDEESDDDADLEDDLLGGSDDTSEVAMVEGQVIEVIASAHGAAQREDWAEVLDCSARLEDHLSRAKAKVATCAAAARILLSTGLKHASGFSDEPRVRSTLGCLMLIEWCVPTCPDAFRQAIASDRWVRKLVDLCRKDTTDQALVRTTIMQLISNWASWYSSLPACDGFEKAIEMLTEAVGEVPPPARQPEDDAQTERAAGAASLGVPGLQLQLQLAPLAPSYLGAGLEGDATSKVAAELDIMREDVRTLEAALSKCDDASHKLNALELADAGQAAMDVRGWQSRLSGLLSTEAPADDAEVATHRKEEIAESVKGDMRALLTQIDGLLAKWAEAAPVARRKKQRASADANEETAPAPSMSVSEVMKTGRLGDVVLPTNTPRGLTGTLAGAAAGAPAATMATPRNPQLFLHNPKLLTARGPLAVPAEIASQLSARGITTRGALASNRMGSQRSQRGGLRPLGAGMPGLASGLKPVAFSKAPPPGAEMAAMDSQRLKVPGLPIPAEPMPHLDLAVASSRRTGTARAGVTTLPAAATDATAAGADAKASDDPFDFGAESRHSLSYLDLALPAASMADETGEPDFFATGFMEDAAFMGDPNQQLDVQLAELSGLLGGDANAPQFLQEMLMLQMQAEAWRMQWSVAMQENEELRAKLYDTRNSLEAAGGGGASGEHWRELCISIAKSAEDEKGQILEQVSTMREDLKTTSELVEERKAEVERLKADTDANRTASDEWSAKANAVIKSRNELNAELYTADVTAGEVEADTESGLMAAEDQKVKTVELTSVAETLVAQLSDEENNYETTLAEVHSSHQEQVEKLNKELTECEEELSQGTAVMNQWRTQWEEELTEKNSIDAELLTLRSEFEKSSSTYDREIDGLKELLEKENRLREEMGTALAAEETQFEEHGQKLEATRSQLAALDSSQEDDEMAGAEAEKKLAEAQAKTDGERKSYEAKVEALHKIEGEIEALKAAMSGDAASKQEVIGTLTSEVAGFKEQAAKFASLVDEVAQTEAKKAAVQVEIESLKSQMSSQGDTAVSEQSALQEALSDARSAAAKWEQEYSLQRAAKSTLLEEVNALKAEAKELTDAHAREVDRLNERLGQLEKVHDTLDVTLAEEEAAHEAAMSERRKAHETKVQQQEAQVAELVSQQEAVRSELAEVRTQLTQDQREREEAEQSMRDVREQAESKTSDAEEREKRLAAALEELQAERARIEKDAAEEKARFEQLTSQMSNDKEEAMAKSKEADERAIEFEKQWVAESKLRKELHNQLEEMVGNLRVYCRVRPASKTEKEGDISVEVKGNDQVIVKDHENAKVEDKKYNFTQVYHSGASQEAVFKDSESLMTSVLDGFNVCIFAYGQSGTGKTFTMEGNEEHPGLVPRAMARIFEDVSSREANYQHDCYISMIEIYNENIRDLLRDGKTDTSKLKYDIMRDPLVGMYVKDLTSEQIHTASHAKALIAQGNKNRAVAATGLNDQSSRSHMIVTLTVRTQNKKAGDNYVGKLSLVDLAGSERLAKSQTTGQAQKETMAINKSLSALGTVIASLATSEKHVPYRDSKLTYLLQDSLGGNSKTLMFVNVGPAQANCGETINSLNFASRAKSVALGKATKNREDGAPDGGNKTGKASTVMAAATKLGDEGEPKASARGGEKKKIGAKAR